jgi:outer membrane lipoprotein SlyB
MVNGMIVLALSTGQRLARIGNNMRAFVLLAIVVQATVAAGCAAHPDPIIDTKGVDPEALAEDWDECEAYSEEIVIAAGAAKGAAVGVAYGAAMGSIGSYGNVSEGAARGAVVGGTKSGLDADRDKQAVFKRCMRGRGYRVLN